jgi:probable rRNA maturation factor
VRVALLRSAVLACVELPEVAARLPQSGGSVALRLTGDRELRRLNRFFLGIDSTTDVLAFPSGELGPPVPSDHVGDIAVSLPAARRQALGFGHPLESELALLCVHGFLHLLGWDHMSADDAAEMNRLTLAALAVLGLGLAEGRLGSGSEAVTE